MSSEQLTLSESPLSDASCKRVATSCLSGAGLQQLMKAIVDVLIPRDLFPGMAVPFRPRHSERIAELLGKDHPSQPEA